MGGVDRRASTTAARSSDDALNDPDAPRRADRARPRPDDRRAGRHAERARLRPAALDRRQPAERAPRLPGRVPRRAGRAPAAGHASTTTRCRPTRGTTCRSANDSSSPAACRSATSGRSASDPSNVPFSKKYFLGGATSIRGWGRYEVSPLSGSGCRSAATACSRSARSCARRCAASSAACCSSTPATSGRESGGFKLERSALRGRPRAALPDADRPDPLRLRLSAESDSRAAGERRAEQTRALAHPFQHRSGVLEGWG